jgi:iron-sulfur cluster repair protein YtfE (RIC family)
MKQEILLEWLTKKSKYYKDTIILRNEIEELVMKENDMGFPKFIKNRELEFQDSIYPLNSELVNAREKIYSWAKCVVQQLREDVRLFTNIPYHSQLIMIKASNRDIPYSVRCSKDIPSGNKLENLLERYVESIRKSLKEIEILAKKIINSEESEERIKEIINKCTLADEVKL